MIHMKITIRIPNSQAALSVKTKWKGYTIQGAAHALEGCPCIGYELYFVELQKECPHLVKEIVKLDEVRHEKIRIGGVGGNILDKRIMYIYTPFLHQGEWAIIAIGLSIQLLITMINKFPFILATKCMMDYDQNVVYARLFSIEICMVPRHHGTLFKLWYQFYIPVIIVLWYICL
jgi:hypothetical protein